MSWSGTVYCRYCGNKGHNSRTCPQKTEHYRLRAQAEVDNGEAREGYWHREYAKRTGKWLNGDVADEMKKRRRGSVRRCKYCNKTGHNTRTCPELKEAKARYMEQAIAAREAVWHGVQELGVGIGALVKGEHYGTPVVYMVAKHNWNGVNHETVMRGQQFMLLQLLTGAQGADRWHRERWDELPHLANLPEELEQRSYAHRKEVVGPVVGGLTPPEGWHEGADIDLKEVFKERKSPDFHDNRWND